MSSEMTTVVGRSESYRNFKMFCELAWETCNNENDFIFMINGPRGSGKSTTGVSFLRYYLPTFLKVKFNRASLREHMVSEADGLSERIHNLPPKHPVVVDEGVLAAYVGDHASRNVKDLTKLFTVCRTKNRAVCVISPEFGDVVSRLRNYCVYRLRMLQRGVSVLYARDNSEGAGLDPFHMKALKDLEGFYDVNTPVEEILKKIKKHPCFKDILAVPHMPIDVKEWYDEYREEMTMGRTEDTSAQRDRVAMVFHNLRQQWDMLKEKKAVTYRDFLDSCCYNPITKDPFWKNPNHLAALTKKINEQLKQLGKITKPVQEEEDETPVT